MSQSYKRFIALLEKWPIDKTKQGRDLSHYLREKLKTTFSGAQIVSAKHDQETEKQFKALENIINNVHQNAHPRTNKITASGLTGEQCQQVLSSEFLEYLNNDNKEFKGDK